MVSEIQSAIFRDIEAHYAARLPLWIEDYKKTGRMANDPYFRDWHIEFTPIENSVWADIRCMGLDFFPQIPACGYFIDFANPFLKVGIECDGKAYHDPVKDQVRDNKLQEDGWTIFRITGAECTRILHRPYDSEYYYPDKASRYDIQEWMNTTSEGIMFAIKALFFDRTNTPIWERYTDDYVGEIYRSIDDHCTTPTTLHLLKTKVEAI